MNQSIFRPVKHFKMTVWTSFLWKIHIQLAEKWPDMAVKQAIVIVIRLYSDYVWGNTVAKGNCWILIIGLMRGLNSLQISQFLKLIISFFQYFCAKIEISSTKLVKKAPIDIFSTFGSKINEFERIKLETRKNSKT